MGQIVIDRKKVFEMYMAKVNQLAEDCDWVTYIGPETLVSFVIDIIEKEYLKPKE